MLLGNLFQNLITDGTKYLRKMPGKMVYRCRSTLLLKYTGYQAEITVLNRNISQNCLLKMEMLVVIYAHIHKKNEFIVFKVTVIKIHYIMALISF